MPGKGPSIISDKKKLLQNSQFFVRSNAEVPGINLDAKQTRCRPPALQPHDTAAVSNSALFVSAFDFFHVLHDFSEYLALFSLFMFCGLEVCPFLQKFYIMVIRVSFQPV